MTVQVLSEWVLKSFRNRRSGRAGIRIDGTALRALRIDKGYLNLAADLQLLTQLFRGCSASTMGLTAIRATEIQRAKELAATILTLFGRRKELRASIEAASDLRNRAFTLFARVYEEARRVVVFLRWYERDADRLVPLLYAKRKERKRKPLLSGDKRVRLDTRVEAELGDQRL